MQFGGRSDDKRQTDILRLKADLAAASVELLSAHCAADRIRLQYSPQDIAAFGGTNCLEAGDRFVRRDLSLLLPDRESSQKRRWRHRLRPWGKNRCCFLERLPGRDYFSTRINSPVDAFTAIDSLAPSRAAP